MRLYGQFSAFFIIRLHKSKIPDGAPCIKIVKIARDIAILTAIICISFVALSLLGHAVNALAEDETSGKTDPQLG
ncbi:MAG: hypothetical protein C4288_21510, partial [Leptolyngbya sp. ERB_1_1]